MGLDVVLVSTYDDGYRVFERWAARHGHVIRLVVTLTAEAHPKAPELVHAISEPTSLLMTTDLTGLATAAITAAAPDLVFVCGYPRRIPDSILTIPRYGTLNVHPSLLPEGRGPNPARLLYDGADTLAATLHRMESTFDTGAILSQRVRPLPEPLNSKAIFDTWLDLFEEIVEEGAARAIAGEPGEPQDPAAATYAARFTPADFLLDLTEPAALLHRRIAVLNMMRPTARVTLPELGETVVGSAELRPAVPGATAGQLLSTDEHGWTVQTADQALYLTKPS